MSDGVNGLSDLERKFRGYTFRHFEHATCKVLRWQAGRTVSERVTVPAYIGQGGRRVESVELEVEKFHLLACGATEHELIEHLQQLPSVARHYVELIGLNNRAERPVYSGSREM